MKLYDNDAYRDEFMEAVYNLLSDDSSNDRANQVIDLFDAAPAVVAEPALSNGPLTLEQLREMDGEPVWCKRTKSYVIIACVKDEPYKQIWFFTNKGKWDTILFHHTKFYRRKPEAQKRSSSC